MTAYQQGDRFEKRVRAMLGLDGYAVWQTRGSKSPADLIAIKPGQVVLVQVKAGVTQISHHEWNALYLLARRLHALPIYAHRDGRAVVYRQLCGFHELHSTDWPSRMWAPDLVRGHA